MSHSDFPMPVWLTEAIDSEKRASLNWWDTSLPKQLKPLLVDVDQVCESVAAITALLAADEQLSHMNDESFYDYLGLPYQTRRQLFQACRLLNLYLVRVLADIARGDFRQEGS